MRPADFIAAIAPAAKASAAVTGIPASFTIAEAALESGWGAHCPGYNLFGVKADRAWKGSTTTKRTREVIIDQPVIITAKFRAYDSWLGSIEDHARFLLVNPRYSAALQCKDGEGFARAVAAAGYATDPDYADKLCSIIRKHNLADLDKGEA